MPRRYAVCPAARWGWEVLRQTWSVKLRPRLLWRLQLWYNLQRLDHLLLWDHVLLLLQEVRDLVQSRGLLHVAEGGLLRLPPPRRRLPSKVLYLRLRGSR